MKFELEIPEQLILDAVNKNVREAISQRSNAWGEESRIKDVVNARWNACVDQRVRDLLADHDAMKSMIDAAVEAKVKAQLNKLMKAAA